MTKLFGTDGIRGLVPSELSMELAYKVGMATKKVFSKGQKITILIGRDTRSSGIDILKHINSGLNDENINLINLGIIPTPAVSFLIRKYNADLGIVISASHNPHEYNGIKFFDKNGLKLTSETQTALEEEIMKADASNITLIDAPIEKENAVEDYTEFLVSKADNINKNLKLIVDTANGSASVTAPLLFSKLGLNAQIINNEFDGTNINENCGSTHTENLQKKVIESKADLGIAYDGDADRCFLVDENGELINGDKILAIAASYLKENNKLKGNTLVGTIMSNLGLEKFCEERDINFIRTNVGDFNILEKLTDCGYSLGGEESGHVIFNDVLNAGDGELTSIILLNIISHKGMKLSKLAEVMETSPSVNLKIKTTKEKKELFKNDTKLQEKIKEVEVEMGNRARLVARASGTENIIRVMVEGIDKALIEMYAYKVKEIIENSIQENI